MKLRLWMRRVFDNIVLTGSNRTVLQILQKCQATISLHIKKRSRFSRLLKQVTISASDNPCVQLTIKLPDTISNFNGVLKRDIHTMANTIYPILINTIIKGDAQIHSISIIIEKGEPTVQVIIEKDTIKRTGAFKIALDCCIPVMSIVDTKRSIPYDIQQVQHLLGISSSIAHQVQVNTN
ncbi:hypothetical protein ZOSMA_66G00410 [Zostera marina]|uniref:Uncharacterized protein n=1 Tax=Zostera marina TaxID=29655 RepID=A0A0K9NS92_ZOSMR|nr:hypothetical protein ZOSMA_66G00410 [Zostera marina]